MDSYKHIMIADDDEDDVELLKMAIKQCALKVEVSAAKDGRALLDLLERGYEPDLIVIDLNMPYMNGYECLNAIRRKKRFNRVPIVILSTSALKSDIDYCLGKGANYYAVKPSKMSDLENLVKVIYNGIMMNGITEQN